MAHSWRPHTIMKPPPSARSWRCLAQQDSWHQFTTSSSPCGATRRARAIGESQARGESESRATTILAYCRASDDRLLRPIGHDGTEWKGQCLISMNDPLQYTSMAITRREAIGSRHSFSRLAHAALVILSIAAAQVLTPSASIHAQKSPEPTYVGATSNGGEVFVVVDPNGTEIKLFLLRFPAGMCPIQGIGLPSLSITDQGTFTSETAVASVEGVFQNDATASGTFTYGQPGGIRSQCTGVSVSWKAALIGANIRDSGAAVEQVPNDSREQSPEPEGRTSVQDNVSRAGGSETNAGGPSGSASVPSP
jgi:hypothetical protein